MKQTNKTHTRMQFNKKIGYKTIQYILFPHQTKPLKKDNSKFTSKLAILHEFINSLCWTINYKKIFLLSSNFHPTPAGCSEHTLILLKLENTLDKIGQVLTIQAQVPTLSKKTWVYTTKLPKFSNIINKKITQSNNCQGCLYYLRCVSEEHARIKIKSNN